MRGRRKGQPPAQQEDDISPPPPPGISQAVERKLRALFNTRDAVATEYLSSTLLGELEEGQVTCPEDVYGILQSYVPEEMLGLCVEDDDDMEVLVGRVWNLLEKEGLIMQEVEDGQGEEVAGCELCEREMPLTRHHLIPRSTHKKYSTRMGLTTEELSRCATICRSHDNDTLAESFNTVDKLLEDEKISQFVAWVRKQRTTTKADALNDKLTYRR